MLIIGALLPWVTFRLNDGPYPAKATLQYFDLPFGLTGFRAFVAILGLIAVVFSLLRTSTRGRVLGAVGIGGAVLAAVNCAFMIYEGGGLGAITAADGATAFGGLVAIAGGVLVAQVGLTRPRTERPHLRTDLPTPVAYLLLLVSFALLLLVIAEVLTAGGEGGVTNPYAGTEFLSVLCFLAAVLAVAQALGLLTFVSELSEQHRVFSIVVLLVCALALPFTGAGTEYWMTVAANIGIYAATAIGLNVVVGLAGLLDLGYVAFLGIGAYVAANVSGAAAAKYDIHLPFIVAAILAAMVAGLFGAVVGSPTLRVRGDYLAIVTLAFGEIFTRSAQNDIGGLTNGSNAIPGVPDVTLLDTGFRQPIVIGSVQLPSGALYYALIVMLVALVMAVFANLKNSRIGRAWIAIREDEDAARAMGIQTGQAKILAFLVGATLAGLAGAVFAHKQGTVAYDSFKFLESVTLLAAVILGGMGTIPGAVLGAALLFVLPEKLREFSDYRLLFFGLALVLIMRFRPQGLIADSHRRAELVGKAVESHVPPEAENPGSSKEARA